MIDMDECKICYKKFKCLGKHIRTHNITSEEYYLKYIGNKTYCDVCDEKTPFGTLRTGYHQFCSVKCHNIAQTGITFSRKEHIKKYCIICSSEFEVMPCFGYYKTCSDECRKKHYTNLRSGKNNPSWLGGKSFEIYGKEFNKELKQKIRKRDNYTCQECGYTEEQLGYNLHIHHINYIKKNNDESNLISLCKSCHSKTNFNRRDWIKYYKNKLGG